MKLGLLVDADGARNGKGKVGLARHLSEDARAPHCLQLFLELVKPPRGLRVDVVAGRLPVAVDSQVRGERVQLRDRLAVRFRVKTGCVGAVRGGELRVHEAVADGQFAVVLPVVPRPIRRISRSATLLPSRLSRWATVTPVIPAPNGDIDLDVILQGGELIRLGRRRPEGAACIRTVDAGISPTRRIGTPALPGRDG